MPPAAAASTSRGGATKRVRRKPANHEQRARLSQLVLQSLEYLSQHTTWSTKAVASLIRSEPRAAALAASCGCKDPGLLGRRVGAVLRRGVNFGILKRQGGRFRFGDGGHHPGERRARTHKRALSSASSSPCAE